MGIYGVCTLCVCVYLAGEGRDVSLVVGQIPDLPKETSESPRQTVDATKPSGHDDRPKQTRQ